MHPSLVNGSADDQAVVVREPFPHRLGEEQPLVGLGGLIHGNHPVLDRKALEVG